MSAADAAIKDHQAWLGYLQPDGLVVSPAALVDAQVVLDRNSIPVQQRFLEFVEEISIGDNEAVSAIPDFPAFLRKFLEWPDDCVFGIDPARPLPDALHVPLSAAAAARTTRRGRSPGRSCARRWSRC